MKKVFNIIFFMIVCMFFMCKINAETVDTTPPVISSIKLDKTSYSPGDNMKITIDASDDISGIFDIVISFIKEGETSWNNENSFLMNLNAINSFNGVNTYTVKIPSTATEGNYTFYEIDIMDNAENRMVYEKYEHNPNSIITDFSLPTITIQGAYTGDLDSPTLTELTFDKTKINPGDTVNVIAKAKDTSQIKQVTLRIKGNSYIMSKIDENTFSTKITLTAPGIYDFKEIQLHDIHGNESIYMYKARESEGGYGGCDNYFTIENGKYDIVVEGIADTTPPVLKNIIVNDKTVKAPGSFFVYVIADDDYSNNLEISMILTRKDGKNSYATAYLYSKENNKYKFQININQYASPGEYEISTIYLKDEAGNTVMYDNNPSEYVEAESFGTYSFKVIEDTPADVITSTNSDNFLDNIQNSEENSYISVDTTKNSIVDASIFESIKGTTKTVSFETNGVRWIFNGEDITESKTIDTKTEIYFIENYDDVGKWDKEENKALVIKFQDNGKLPGKVLIKIKADYAFRDYIGSDKLKLYYLNGNNFDLISKGIMISKEGYYEFYIDHNSTYFLTNGDVSKKYVANDYSKELGNDELNKKVKEEIKEESIDNKLEEELETKEENNEVVNKSNKKKNNIKMNKVLIYSIIILVFIIILVVTYIIIKNKKKNKLDKTINKK